MEEIVEEGGGDGSGGGNARGRGVNGRERGVMVEDAERGDEGGGEGGKVEEGEEEGVEGVSNCETKDITAE